MSRARSATGNSLGTLLVAVVAALLAAGTLPAQAADVLKIGVAVPLSGPSARVGEETSKVAKWWARKVEAEHGVKVELVVRDTTFKTPDAINAVERLATEDKVSAIVGIWHSNQGIAVTPVMQRLRVPLVFVGAASNKVLYGPDTMNNKDFVWRPSLNEYKKGELVGQFLLDVFAPRLGRAPRVFYMGEDSEFAVDLMESTRAYVDKHGRGKIESVNQLLKHAADSKTLVNELNQARAARADVIVTAPSGAVTAVFTNEMRTLGVKAVDVGYVGEVATTEFVKLTGDNRWYTTFAIYYAPGRPMTSKTLAWEAEFQKELPEYKIPSSFSAILWEGLESVRTATRIAGSTDPARINAAIPRVEFEGVRNRVVKYDPRTHDGAEMFYALAQFQQGAPGLGFRVIWPPHVKEADFQMPPWVKR